VSWWLKIRNKFRELETRFEAQFRHEPPHPQELLPDILNHVEEKITLLQGNRRGFPFTLLRVYLPEMNAESQALFRTIYEGDNYLAQQIRQRLRERVIQTPFRLDVELKFVSERTPEWTHRWFYLQGAGPSNSQFERRQPSSFIPARLTVIQGQANKQSYDLDSPRRVDIGRLEEVSDAKGIPRRINEVAFCDDRNEINRSVGREHAHLAFDPATSEWRLYADSHRSNTNILRDGRTISVSAGGRRGERLFHNDVIICGRARLLFELGSPENV